MSRRNRDKQTEAPAPEAVAKPPDPAAELAFLLGTADTAQQVARLKDVLTARPVSILIVADPKSGETTIRTTGPLAPDLAYKMLDVTRAHFFETERKALASQNGNGGAQ